MRKRNLLPIIVAVGMLSVGGKGQATSLSNDVGATVNETYQDWDLSCHVKDDKKVCSVTQSLSDPKTQQRSYRVTFKPEGGQIHGVVLSPFGLDINHGMALVTENLPVGDFYPFATCMPEGCIVPLDMDENQLEELKKSNKASLSFSTISGQTVKLPLSIKGLAEALNRASSIVN